MYLRAEQVFTGIFSVPPVLTGILEMFLKWHFAQSIVLNGVYKNTIHQGEVPDQSIGQIGNEDHLLDWNHITHLIIALLFDHLIIHVIIDHVTITVVLHLDWGKKTYRNNKIIITQPTLVNRSMRHIQVRNQIDIEENVRQVRQELRQVNSFQWFKTIFVHLVDFTESV